MCSGQNDKWQTYDVIKVKFSNRLSVIWRCGFDRIAETDFRVPWKHMQRPLALNICCRLFFSEIYFGKWSVGRFGQDPTTSTRTWKNINSKWLYVLSKYVYTVRCVVYSLEFNWSHQAIKVLHFRVTRFLPICFNELCSNGRMLSMLLLLLLLFDFFQNIFLIFFSTHLPFGWEEHWCRPTCYPSL